jgi:sulfane dehydrogenase subunit SoxC
MRRTSFLQRAFAALAGTNLIPSWTQAPGSEVPAYGTPSSFERAVVRSPAPARNIAQTPLASQRGIITASGLCFVRCHAGVPAIDPAQHRLLVHGLVKGPLFLSMDDILRLPAVSRIYFLECSGNSGSEWRGPSAPTVQESHGLASCCEWTGVRLRDVFDMVGVQPSARWFLAEGADAAAFDRSIPLAKAYDDALLVYGQNGEMLRPEQGYPLRLIVPGYEGSGNVKWLRRIKLLDRPVYSREETARYTDLMPNGTARAFTFVMETKSVIASPSGGQRVASGRNQVTGFAWSGRGKIARVDVSFDGGSSWRHAPLDTPVLTKAFSRFSVDWDWNGHETTLLSRAADETGYVQPTRAQLVHVRGVESGYHNNAIHGWRVTASGDVTKL